MKLQLQRETLLKPLQLIMGVVERKQTLPILSNVLLDARDNNLSITGTDLEVELIGKTILEQTTTSESKLTLPGKKLIDICKALPESAPIELYQEKERVILRSGRSRFTLSTLPADDFPNAESLKGQFNFSIPQNQLLRLLQRTYFAMAQQDVRYYLNGMLFEVTKGSLRAVATDGHRLATNIIDANIDEEHRIQIIIPRKGVLELMRLLEEKDEPITVSIGNSSLCISNDDYTFTSKLIEGRFPDYERVIPKDSNKSITIDREELKRALSRAAILCNEKFRGLRFELRSGLLRIFANNPEQEVAEEELSIDYNQEDLDIGFNVSYFLDILQVLQSKDITIKLRDAGSSLLISEAGNTGDSIYVVMPMRL